MNKKRKIKPLRLLIVIQVFLLIVACVFGVIFFIYSKNKEVISEIVDNTNKDIIYLAVGDTYQLDHSFVSNKENSKQFLSYSSSNPESVYVDNEGRVKAIGDGESTITISIADLSDSINIVSTSLILPINNNVEKINLPINIYSKKDNDLLDEILKDRVNEAGYNSRDGVVAAAKFLVYEFPYRINYFYENNRLDRGIDGEGRYYHEGLYLNDSRFGSLIGSSEEPGCWGTLLYSEPAEIYMENGLDCSGFVTWALLNGGYDCGDVGAGGVDYPTNTLFYFGERVDASLEVMKDVKPGDLVHNEKGGGHIGIIIEKDDSSISVAQATWDDPYLFDPPYGVVPTKYTYEEFVDDWNEIMLMDSYYK